jgi:hypothetical protein
MRSKIDYSALEKMYVTEDKTYAELARLTKITAQSVSEYGKRNDWPGKRAAYRAAISRRGYEQVAEAVSFQQTTIINEAIAVARATLRQYANGIVAGTIPVSAKDAAEMIRLLVKELSPDGTRDSNGPTVIDNQSEDADFLRRIVEASRGRAASTGGVGTALAVRAPRARAN